MPTVNELEELDRINKWKILPQLLMGTPPAKKQTWVSYLNRYTSYSTLLVAQNWVTRSLTDRFVGRRTSRWIPHPFTEKGYVPLYFLCSFPSFVQQDLIRLLQWFVHRRWECTYVNVAHLSPMDDIPHISLSALLPKAWIIILFHYLWSLPPRTLYSSLIPT